ncbi:MAG TPA: hypothetical protein VM366_21265 [Anaerolineae bacterium]|nr:hypothetical protein [Anaerolineae bacterium]
MSAEVPEFIERYVTALKSEGWFESAQVERALRRVQRHQLIEQVVRGASDVVQIDPRDPEHLQMIYSDRALLTRPFPNASSSLQPGLVARRGSLPSRATRCGTISLCSGGGAGSCQGTSRGRLSTTLGRMR